jgi:hypothetical protein
MVDQDGCRKQRVIQSMSLKESLMVESESETSPEAACEPGVPSVLELGGSSSSTPVGGTVVATPAGQVDQVDTGPLTLQAIADGLSRRSFGLVDEIHTIALRQMQSEDVRETRLDSKAQGLLITAGLTLTVAFTFGGMLIDHSEYLKAINGGVAVGCFVLYAAAMLSGLFASLQAVRALKVTGDYRSVNERDVFNERELTEADDSCADETNASENAKAVAMYRRYMTSHYWVIWQRHFTLHARKARIIKSGQWAFLAFLVLMMVIGGAMAFAALNRAYFSSLTP